MTSSFAPHRDVASIGILSQASYQYFKHLLLNPTVLTGESVETYVPHRLIIAYFAFNGMVACTAAREIKEKESLYSVLGPSVISNYAGLSDNEVKLVVRQLLACYSVAEGGFCPMPVSLSSCSGVGSCRPTITMTYCALHILCTLGMLRNGVDDPNLNPIDLNRNQGDIKKDVYDESLEQINAVLCFDKIRKFVFSCWIEGKGFSAEPLRNYCDSNQCKSFSSLSSEVDVRSTFGALMTLWMISGVRERRYRNAKIIGNKRSQLQSAQVEFRQEISTLFQLKENDTSFHINDNNNSAVNQIKEKSPFWERIVESILCCYIPHEGAFSSCGGIFSNPFEFPSGNLTIPHYQEMISQHNGAEGHSGMTFCAVVSLVLLGFWNDDNSPGTNNTLSSYPYQQTELNTTMRNIKRRDMRDSILRYCCARQGHFGEVEMDADEEGEIIANAFHSSLSAVGFQGRPNKDSDTCYSFWLLSTISLLNRSMGWEKSLVDYDEKETHVNEFLNASSSSFLKSELSTAGAFDRSLHDMMSLQKFTLITAGLDTSSHSENAPFLTPSDVTIGVISKYPEVECDPVHAFLGLAGAGGKQWWSVVSEDITTNDDAAVVGIKELQYRVVSAPLISHVILKDVLFL